MATEPEGAPHCWGKQFQDGDDECTNCDYNSSCRPATLHQISLRRPATPIYQPYQTTYAAPPPPPQPMYQPPRYAAPMMPPQPPFPQPPSNYPRPAPTFGPPTTAPTAPPIHHQQHAPQGWNTPIAYLPRPNPATPAWWQYSGETTGSRLTKNVILSALQAIFAELLRFLTNWTWPSSQYST